jgi:UDP-N-acetylmuramyl pentapeptide synthase
MEEIADLLRPRHVVFTGFSRKHLEFFPSRAALLNEKINIFRYVPEQNGNIVLAKELRGKKVFSSWEKFLPPPKYSRKKCDFSLHSNGFKKNFLLCAELCSCLGVSWDQICERVRQWKMPKLRGQIFSHRTSGQIYYLDCYNSDFPALVDSAQTFTKIFSGEKRLFIIGGMSELGNQSDAIHWRAGEKFPAAPGDHFFFLGKETEPMRDALLLRGFPKKNLRNFQEKSDIRDGMGHWPGPIYLKGSRCYALETLIDFDSCDLLN